MFDVLDDLKRQNVKLLVELAIRNRQHDIAVEGLNNIVSSNDPVGIAAKTLEAMDECRSKPDNLE